MSSDYNTDENGKTLETPHEVIFVPDSYWRFSPSGAEEPRVVTVVKETPQSVVIERDGKKTRMFKCWLFAATENNRAIIRRVQQLLKIQCALEEMAEDALSDLGGWPYPRYPAETEEKKAVEAEVGKTEVEMLETAEEDDNE